MSSKIEFHDVTKAYQQTVIFQHQDYRMRPGLTFLVGKNGAGKTTLIRLAMGLEAANSGQVLLFGAPAEKANRAVKRKVGLQLQNEAFMRCVRAGEYIQLYEALYGSELREGTPRLGKVWEMLEIEPLIRRYAYTLSGGEKKRLSLYLTIVGNKELIILDEPTAGIDVEVKDRIVSVIMYLRSCGCDVMVSSHDLEEFYTVCDNVLMLNQGVVFDGLKKDFEAVYDYRYRVEAEESVGDDPRLVEGKLFERRYLYSRERETLLEYFPDRSIEKTTAKDLYQIALLDHERKGDRGK